MDIKLIKNSENSRFLSIHNGLLLQITDDNYKLLNLAGKRLYVLNTVSNERFEIAPGVKKYILTDISYAYHMHDYVFYTSAELHSDSRVEILVYRYSFDENESEIVYRFETEPENITQKNRFRIFVFDYNYFIIQQSGKNNLCQNILMHDISVDKDVLIEGSYAQRMGISSITALEGNNCVIKFGQPKPFGQSGTNDRGELIGIVNAKQFVSELKLNPVEVTMDVLDSSDEHTTFPYMKRSENRIIYSKFNLKTMSEEIVIYDYENKVKQVRLNNNINEASDLSHTYIMNDNPYMIKKSEKHSYIVNLNTMKAEIRLSQDFDIKFLKNDIIVICHKRHRIPFLKKGSNYIEVYRMPDMHHSLLKTKAEYKGCLVNDDDLMLFTL